MIRRAFFLTLLFLCLSNFCLAQETLLTGTIISNDVNIRSDSRVTSEVISTLKKRERVTIVKEAYGWYKIILPKNAPLFVRKDLAERIDQDWAKVTKSRVNLRLKPNEESPILGSMAKDRVFKIISEENGWYRIEPNDDSFGWVYKSFVSPIEPSAAAGPDFSAKKQQATAEILNLEGRLTKAGGIFKQPAPYKLMAADKKTYFVNAKPGSLDSFINKEVKLTARISSPEAAKHPLLEIEKIEKAQ